jgi:leucyl aminopeptidase
VGKGITFDSGGISIKPSEGMEKMKYDMSGAAAVVGSLWLAAKMKLAVNLIGLAPTCENLPSEKPQRPGDIITISNGKTVEVVNTDAEGRLILADGLSYAARYKPQAIIDLATLTHSCRATFGELCIGMMGNDASLIEKVKEAGEKSGGRVWELPLWEDYRDHIKSDVADIKNVGKGVAGAISAGKFLEEFVGDFPWVHLDIASTAWLDSDQSPFTKGPSGAGVRVVNQFLRDSIS